MQNKSKDPSTYTVKYVNLKSVTAPEDQEAGRKRYTGVCAANELFQLNTAENVRSYLGVNEDGARRKSTSVNMAIRDTVETRRDLFPVLNSGVVMVARGTTIDDNARTAVLRGASIING